MYGMRDYIVGTGWWCDGTGSHEGSRRNKSTNDIRKPEFFNLWYRYVHKFTRPKEIVIIDSASPVKPDFKILRHKSNIITLEKNEGHGAGWWRGVFESAKYAMSNRCDYVYIEQDCLVFGIGWIDNCRNILSKFNLGIMLGDGKGTPQVLQQSLIVVTYEKLEYFLKQIDPYMGDKGISNESLFATKLAKNYMHLPFGVGRARPIPFNRPYWYAQHFTQDELETVCDISKTFLNKGSDGVYFF